jgi:hypothetical protein
MNNQYRQSQQDRLDQVQFVYYLYYHPLTTNQQKDYLLEFLIDAIAKDEVENIKALSDEELYKVIRKEGFCSPLDYDLSFEDAIHAFNYRSIITNFDTSGFASNIEVTRLMAEFLRWREGSYTIPLESYTLPCAILLRNFGLVHIRKEDGSSPYYHLVLYEGSIGNNNNNVRPNIEPNLILMTYDFRATYEEYGNGKRIYKLTKSQLEQVYNKL